VSSLNRRRRSVRGRGRYFPGETAGELGELRELRPAPCGDRRRDGSAGSTCAGVRPRMRPVVQARGRLRRPVGELTARAGS
jgi:hypothetical protein